jgi:hypothetical protein
VFILEKEIEKPLGLYGVLFRSIIKIMQLFLLIFGILIGAFFLPIAIKPLAKKRVKPTILNVLIIHYDSGFLG